MQKDEYVLVERKATSNNSGGDEKLIIRIFAYPKGRLQVEQTELQVDAQHGSYTDALLYFD